mgnify:CR=1 FL=1|tara:strand:- start:5363 stop:6340 length:978 start_codon:yes stop_codon:yes gene_type:complete
MEVYKDFRLSDKSLLREFKKNDNDMELEWHRDDADRLVHVLDGNGWQFQFDNMLPESIQPGDKIFIPSGQWHRLHAGEGKLSVYIQEGKDQNKDGENDFDDVKIARMLASGMSKEEIKEKHPELFEEYLNEKKKKKKKTDFDPGGQQQYRDNRTQKQIDTQADLTRKYNAATTEKQKQKYRDMIDRSREKEGVAESVSITKYHLNELISEVVEAEKLAMILEKIEELEEKKKRKKRKKKKKKGGGLSAAVKKSLDKKADKRGLTRGSVYAEFRKGLAAYYSSGSRKGMSAHQWAHARVNSANPSKSWAVVKKSKAKKKKKKGKKK